MNLHEYQAKELFKQYNLPVLPSILITDFDQINQQLENLGGSAWVAKAQVYAGGRGKAGGIKIVNSHDALKKTVQMFLNTRLVTEQTDANGQLINKVLVEPAYNIKIELYVAVVVDRKLECPVLMVSRHGGTNIEQSASGGESLLQLKIDPFVGILHYQVRQVLDFLNIADKLSNKLQDILQKIVKVFLERDLSLLEINPLAINDKHEFMCIDAKVSVDDNALYRQHELKVLRDLMQEDPRETNARAFHLNYIALHGEIGCMVNGAGLAMAILDLIHLHGSSPANFLDVGGTATVERIQEAFKILFYDNQVKVILINILGGIVGCDLIAMGMLKALNNITIKKPMVIRLQGNNDKIAKKMLIESVFDIVVTDCLDAAVTLAINKASK